MKQIIRLLVALFFIPAFAQSQSTLDQGGSGSKEATTTKNSGGHSYNFLKVNLMSLPLGNYSFQYERVLNRKLSLAIGVRFMPDRGVPMKNAILSTVNDDPDTEDLINDLRLKNFAFTPELRFYLSKKGYGKGFYLAPYYRYATFSASGVSVDYETSTNTTSTIRLSGDMTTHCGGLMLGAQWFIGKSVTLDWWILGAHYGKGNGTFTGLPSTLLTPSEQADIRDEINGVELPFGSVKAEVSANSVKAIIDGPWAGLRAGLSLGIRF